MKMKKTTDNFFNNIDPWGRIHNKSFILNLRIGPNKLECSSIFRPLQLSAMLNSTLLVRYVTKNEL
jgi:hypothetical protein